MSFPGMGPWNLRSTGSLQELGCRESYNCNDKGVLITQTDRQTDRWEQLVAWNLIRIQHSWTMFYKSYLNPDNCFSPASDTTCIWHWWMKRQKVKFSKVWKSLKGGGIENLQYWGRNPPVIHLQSKDLFDFNFLGTWVKGVNLQNLSPHLRSIVLSRYHEAQMGGLLRALALF